MTIAISAPDRPALWPLLAMASVFAGLVLVDAALEWEPPFDALALLLVLALWCAAAMAAASLAVQAGRQGQPRRAASLALLPLAFLVTVAQPKLVMGGAQTLGDRLHFMIEYQEYLALIRAMPDTGEPKLLTVDWGGFLTASTSLVYDESDEMALPPERRSTAWRARAQQTILSCAYGYWVRTTLGGHFYAVGVGC
ncbi:hypothetical protein [Nitrospirillum sp. BR 11828]|uniref:hypothetical protein n=1 Tax=Nitrospirillum sp. BR 11828 TaxID=3104325 RepID=UPI002ACABDC1|nr:hypothetical protein [Nitrospirillum sp. BR 11828]MDZ5650488.1 hypothetical protein [Nitrospirillum sp. BR 11828]